MVSMYIQMTGSKHVAQVTLPLSWGSFVGIMAVHEWSFIFDSIELIKIRYGLYFPQEQIRTNLYYKTKVLIFIIQ
jgi:hypothetical protein